MTQKKKKTEEKGKGGLWIPSHICNIPNSVLDHFGKKVYAHIYSFGEKGCWQSNETIGEIFMVSGRTISRRISAIKEAKLVYVKNPKGYYRTFWAKSHPEVQAAVKLWYKDKEIPKTEAETGPSPSTPLGQDCPTDLDRTGKVTATDGVFPLGQDCPTTNTDTYKETNKKTTATPPPLPAGGQAPALLEERKKESVSEVEQLKRKFGRVPRRAKMPPAEFEQRRQINKKALLGDKKN